MVPHLSWLESSQRAFAFVNAMAHFQTIAGIVL